jgi:hypothetical protein
MSMNVFQDCSIFMLTIFTLFWNIVDTIVQA